MEYETSESNDSVVSNDPSSINTENMLQERSTGDASEKKNTESSFVDSFSGLTTPNNKQFNRRYSHRPRKCISKDIGCNLKKLMKKTPKNNNFVIHQNLETIFEEPIVTKKGELVLIGLSKAKRSITFSQFVTKAKLKKRKIKAKKLREKQLAERKKMEDVEDKFWKLGL